MYLLYILTEYLEGIINLKILNLCGEGMPSEFLRSPELPRTSRKRRLKKGERFYAVGAKPVAAYNRTAIVFVTTRGPYTPK